MGNIFFNELEGHGIRLDDKALYEGMEINLSKNKRMRCNFFRPAFAYVSCVRTRYKKYSSIQDINMIWHYIAKCTVVCDSVK